MNFYIEDHDLKVDYFQHFYLHNNTFVASETGVIAGSVGGVVVLLALVGVVAAILIRKRIR